MKRSVAVALVLWCSVLFSVHLSLVSVAEEETFFKCIPRSCSFGFGQLTSVAAALHGIPKHLHGKRSELPESSVVKALVRLTFSTSTAKGISERQTVNTHMIPSYQLRMRSLVDSTAVMYSGFAEDGGYDVCCQMLENVSCRGTTTGDDTTQRVSRLSWCPSFANSQQLHDRQLTGLIVKPLHKPRHTRWQVKVYFFEVEASLPCPSADVNERHPDQQQQQQGAQQDGKPRSLNRCRASAVESGQRSMGFVTIRFNSDLLPVLSALPDARVSSNTQPYAVIPQTGGILPSSASPRDFVETETLNPLTLPPTTTAAGREERKESVSSYPPSGVQSPLVRLLLILAAIALSVWFLGVCMCFYNRRRGRSHIVPHWGRQRSKANE